MPTPAILTTTSAISAVYDWLGRPDKALLSPPVVCTKYWAQLDYVQQLLNISDRTVYLKQAEATLSTNEQERDLGELDLFGTPLGLEIVDRKLVPEHTIPVPLISDMRQRDSVAELAAFLYRDGSTGNPVLRFNRPLQATTTFRLWYDPSAYGRPGRDERAFLPAEAINYVVIETADSCTPDLLRIYDANVARGYAENIEKQREKFGRVFRIWSTKDLNAGVKHRRAFNENRRGGGGVGRPPLIGEI